jgi:hypothetical protein
MVKRTVSGIPLLLALAALPAAGAAQEPAAGDLPAANSLPVAPGLYASRQYVSNRAQTRPSGRYVRVRTTNYVLHSVEASEDGLSVTSTYCQVEQEPLGRVRTELGPRFVAAMPSWVAPLEVDPTGDGPESIRVPDRTIVLGAELRDPDRDRLPDDPEDPRVTDPDVDGNPGITVEVRGLVSGQVYLVQRLVRGLSGTIEADGRITGTVTGGGDQAVIGASNAILRTFTPTFEHNPDPERNTFVWVPVPEDATCESVVAGREQLFGND